MLVASQGLPRALQNISVAAGTVWEHPSQVGSPVSPANGFTGLLRAISIQPSLLLPSAELQQRAALQLPPVC